MHEALSGCDLVALESNYDLRMLRSGPYPYYLRARIESARGHLSNDECSAKLLELVQEGCKKFALCHLSQENNTPMLALQTVFNTLGAAGVVPEKDCVVQAQRRNEVSRCWNFKWDQKTPAKAGFTLAVAGFSASCFVRDVCAGITRWLSAPGCLRPQT